MKKLNNRGWGLSVMIAFLCGLILFLLLAMFLAWRFGIGQNSPVPLVEETEQVESD